MAEFVRLSEATALALHTMALVAAAKGGAVSVAGLASELSASESHLSKVMQRLAKAGFLRAKRGPNGGYTLGHPAGEISLLAIYEAMEGPIRRDECLFVAPVCRRGECILGDLVGRVRREVRTYLEQTTLRDLTEN